MSIRSCTNLASVVNKRWLVGGEAVLLEGAHGRSDNNPMLQTLQAGKQQLFLLILTPDFHPIVGSS
jgi:hypothetical protein